MKYMKINKILLVVLVLAAFLRLWKLGTIPPGLTPDEASLGYNSYSILKTAKDEYGKTLPFIFKSFGDYKPGLYVYLDVPFTAAFGLDEVSTRLPSALFGILAVYLVYLISKEFFKENKPLPIIAAFVAAVNPWLIYFSRGAWEANVSLGLTLLGVYFFLKSFKKNWFILLSAFSFGLTLLTYQGAKLSSFIVIFLLIAIYWKKFWSLGKKYLFSSFAVGLLVSLPILLSVFGGETGRLTVFSIFSYHRPASEVARYSGPFYGVFHSEGLNYARAIAGRWFNTFSGKFLFFEGDMQNPVDTAPYQGVLLITDLLFLVIGFYVFFKERIGKKYLFIFGWLMLAPFSAAISRDTTSAVRSLNTAIPLIFIISFGLYFFISKWKKWGSLVAFSLYLISFVYFLDAYFIHVPAHNSELWRYGYKQAIDYVMKNGGDYNKIVFEQSYNQPYIYFLYYEKYDPAKYQKEASLVTGDNPLDVGLVKKLNNITFTDIDWQLWKKESGTLIITGPVHLPPDWNKDAKTVKEIRYLNNRDVAFDILKIK